MTNKERRSLHTINTAAEPEDRVAIERAIKQFCLKLREGRY